MKKIPKKEKFEEITLKDFQNLYDDVNKLEAYLENLKSTPKILQNLSEQVKKSQVKIEENQIASKILQNLTIQGDNFKDEMKLIKEELSSLKDQILTSQERLEQTIRTQEEIIMDMINKFNEELLNHKSSILEDIEKLKSQQDILKISYTVNEKKMMEKVKSIINETVNFKIGGKESEILMKIWINELKDIIDDFEKLKKEKPQEFSIKLNKIADTIDLFKEKLHEY